MIRKGEAAGGRALQTGDALILVDDKEVTVEEMEKLNPDAISRMEVLKARNNAPKEDGRPAAPEISQEATEKRKKLLQQHGAKADRDVILITTK